MYNKKFCIVLVICLLTNILCTAIGWFESVDVKGWWPLGLALYFLISVLYATSFSWIDRRFGRITLKFSLIHSFFLSTTLLIHTALYYFAKPDWAAVHNGTTTLTVLQRAVFSDYSIYAIYGGFLILAALRVWMSIRSHEPIKSRGKPSY